MQLASHGLAGGVIHASLWIGPTGPLPNPKTEAVKPISGFLRKLLVFAVRPRRLMPGLHEFLLFQPAD